MASSRIRTIRREKEMSGTELAEMLNISAQYYYDIEKGKRNLSAENATKLAKIFGVSVDYLLGVSDIRNFGNQLVMEYDTGTLREETDQESLRRIESYKEFVVTNALNEKIEEVWESDDSNKTLIAQELNKIKENYPKFSTSRDIKDLNKFLEQSEIMFDGVPMTDEDKARIQGYMESMFWDAKQKNKRKKQDEE